MNYVYDIIRIVLGPFEEKKLLFENVEIDERNLQLA
jgi:hypothetical protein